MNMNKYERLNQQKKYRSEKSFSGKKRVAAYCRVSTEKEEQAQSFESQCDFFRCYIEQKKEWEFYKVFADEGISGTSTKKREQFNRMIAEAKQRKFDLLITKEISRFARNTLDSIYYTRELRKVGVGVLFLNDGINTIRWRCGVTSFDYGIDCPGREPENIGASEMGSKTPNGRGCCFWQEYAWL